MFAEALVQFSLNLLTVYHEDSGEAVICFRLKLLYLALTLHYQSYSHTLHSAC